MPQPLTLEAVVAHLVPMANPLMTEHINRDYSTDRFTWQNDLFHVKPGTAYSDMYESLNQTPSWPEWRENEPLTLEEFDTMDQTRVRPHIFRKGFPVSALYLKYGNGQLDPLSVYVNQLEVFTKKFLEAGMRRLPEMAAGVFLNAFSSSAQPMPDGTALCANSHTDIPDDNYTTTKLSTQLLDEFDSMATGIDSVGEPRVWNWDTLVVSPKNQNLARRLLFSQNFPGNNDNDINPWQGRYRLKVCPWLTEDVQTGASDYVFAIDSRQHNLIGTIYQLPAYNEPFQRDSMTYIFDAMTMFTYFALNNAGIAGSLGTVAPS